MTGEEAQQLRDHARNIAEAYVFLEKRDQRAHDVPHALLTTLWKANELVSGYASYMMAR